MAVKADSGGIFFRGERVLCGSKSPMAASGVMEKCKKTVKSQKCQAQICRDHGEADEEARGKYAFSGGDTV